MKDQLEALVNQMIEQGVDYTDAVSEFEKRFIKAMLERNHGNQSKAALALKIHRNTLSRKITDLHLDHRTRRRGRARR